MEFDENSVLFNRRQQPHFERLRDEIDKLRFPPPPAPVVDRPGRFRVVSVDRATKMDTEWYCDAASADNAKVKAELEGIIVTKVERA